MKPRLVELLVCPRCASEFSLDATETDGDEVRTGALECVGGHAYPIQEFVPRFVDSDHYADSFSKQRLYVRRHFEHYANDRGGDARLAPSTGIELAELKTGISLEVGCGYGRYLDVVQRNGGEIVGVDLSTHSVDLARDFVGRRAGVHVVQCDLFHLPFRQGTFDRVFSLGVLHHTPDTRQAFEAIVPYARSGGRVSIWVYHPRNKLRADRWRKLTTRLPHSALYGWCVLNQALFSWVRAIPLGFRALDRLIPGAPPTEDNSFWTRVLGDFDSLSPEYAYSHTPEDVRAWFAEAGLEGIEEPGLLTAVTGRRP